MKRINYFLAAAMLSGATMVGFTSCDDDDDDSSSSQGTQQTSSVTKPVEGTDFTVAVDGTNVTVSTSLTYGNMYVLYDGVQTAVKDGKAVLNIPIAGDYKFTFNIYENGVNTASDEVSVTISATDLSFLDEGVFKTLTGGKAAYEAATADANGYKFTRSWRIDAFLAEIGTEYTKSGYAGGVGFFGSDWWACAGSYKGSWQNDAAHGITDAAEDATIAFDPVNNVVKFTVKTAYDTTYIQGMKANNGAYTAGLLPAGTYYTKFSYNKVDEQYGADGAAEQILNNAGTTLSDSYLEIKFDKTAIGDNGFVRMPLHKIYGGWTSIFENQYLNFKLMTDATSNVLHAVIGRSVDGGAQTTDTEGDNCLLFYTYISDELDAAGAYTYEIPSYTVDDVVASSVAAADIQGTWKIASAGSPFGWINWADNKTFNAWADFNTACTTVKDWWAFGNPDDAETATKMDATIAEYVNTVVTLNADGTYVINDALNAYADGAYTAKEFNGTYTYENGYIKFSSEVTLTCASVTMTGTEFYVVAPAGSEDGEGANDDFVKGGLWLGVTNGDKTETAAIHFAK